MVNYFRVPKSITIPKLLSDGVDGLPSNGLAFSCRERAAQDDFKKQRSRARSGQLQRRVGRARRLRFQKGVFLTSLLSLQWYSGRIV